MLYPNKPPSRLFASSSVPMPLNQAIDPEEWDRLQRATGLYRFFEKELVVRGKKVWRFETGRIISVRATSHDSAWQQLAERLAIEGWNVDQQDGVFAVWKPGTGKLRKTMIWE